MAAAGSTCRPALIQLDLRRGLRGEARPMLPTHTAGYRLTSVCDTTSHTRPVSSSKDRACRPPPLDLRACHDPPDDPAGRMARTGSGGLPRYFRRVDASRAPAADRGPVVATDTGRGGAEGRKFACGRGYGPVIGELESLTVEHTLPTRSPVGATDHRLYLANVSRRRSTAYRGLKPRSPLTSVSTQQGRTVAAFHGRILPKKQEPLT